MPENHNKVLLSPTEEQKVGERVKLVLNASYVCSPLWNLWREDMRVKSGLLGRWGGEMKRTPEREHGQSALYARSPALCPINTHLFLNDL